MMQASLENGLEGVIAKRLDSVYEMGRRSGAWLKVKNRQRQELVIGGWVDGEGRRRGLPGALLLGYYDGDPFVYAALAIPVHGVTGEIALHQIRPDDPRRNIEGKAIKYETPRKARMALDVPPSVRPLLGNPQRAPRGHRGRQEGRQRRLRRSLLHRRRRRLELARHQ